MINFKVKLILLALVATIAGAAIAVPLQQYFYSMNGGVQLELIGVTVTWADTGEEFLGYDWGIVNNSKPTLLEAPLNITNIENTPANLTLTTKDLSGTITDIILDWNYTGVTLQPKHWVIVELNQTITTTGDWSYTMVITATEA